MEIPNNLFEIKYEIKLHNYENKYMPYIPNKAMHYVVDIYVNTCTEIDISEENLFNNLPKF